MLAYAPRFSLRLFALFTATVFYTPAAIAQAPNWVRVVDGESLFVDTGSLTLNPTAPAGQKWVDFDVLLNTPVPSTQADAAELNAFFGTEPKTFFNHMTINCTQLSVREQSSGMAYGHFKTLRRDANGNPLQALELDQLIEYDLHSQPQFESLADSPEATPYQQLLCQSATPESGSGHDSLAQLNQAVPNVSAPAELVPLANYPHKFIDKRSIKQRHDHAHIRDFNIVYQMPKDDPQFDQVTQPYGLDGFTMVFDRSINCDDHSMRSNYRAIAPTYAPNAPLLEYRPQEDAAYLPITAEEQTLYDQVCPTPIAMMPLVTPPLENNPVAKPKAPASRTPAFRTEYDSF